MHSTIGNIGMNRKGRKRKSGRREPSGRIQRRPIDYRSMAAVQPHRIWLPESVRCDERASTVIGCLNLLNRISDQMYESGRRYSVVVGNYRAVLGVGNTGGGRGYLCSPMACEIKTCECVRRKQQFRDATSVLLNVSQQAYNITYRTAVSEEPCTADQLVHLKYGLQALAQFFGLTARGKS